jgi:hypothetical protein
LDCPSFNRIFIIQSHFHHSIAIFIAVSPARPNALMSALSVGSSASTPLPDAPHRHPVSNTPSRLLR